MDPLAIFVECDGLVPFALEKINRPVCSDFPSTCSHEPVHDLVTADGLTAMLAKRLPELQDLARAKILMASYAAARLAIATATAKLGELQPFEASKTATNLIDKLVELTKRPDDHSTNINQLIWNGLPDEQSRQAWLYITKQQPESQLSTAPKVIDYDWELPSEHLLAQPK